MIKTRKIGKRLVVGMAMLMLLGMAGCGKSDEKKKYDTLDEMEVDNIKDSTPKNSKDASQTEKDNLQDIETDDEGYMTPEYRADNEDEAKNCKEKMIVLSGRKSDVYKVDQDCYYKSDKFVMYFKQGTVISGDAAAAVESVMERLEEMYGFSYDNLEHLTTYPWRRNYVSITNYNGINTDNKRVNIIIKPYEEGNSPEYTDDSVVLLYDKYLDMESGDFGNVIAGLARALRQRQSRFMGDIFESGFALYNEEKLGREYNLPDAKMLQFIDVTEDQFNKNDVINDPKGLYKEQEEGEEKDNFMTFNYPYLNNYGYRFVSFLEETYGPEIIKKISDASLESDYDYGFVDIELDIIKKAAGDDVFDKFSNWLINDWDNYIKDYRDYLNSVTAD